MSPQIRRFAAVAAALAAAIVLLPAPAGAGTPARGISMRDNRFLPSTTVVAQGQRVQFTNYGQVAHDAEDQTGLDLFATAVLSPGDTETIGPLPGSGSYRYYCSFHPEMVGRLQVPVTVSRTASPARRPVTVRWAATRPAADVVVVDIQRRRPGTRRFVEWRTGVSATGTRWWPAVRGRWLLRARVRAEGGHGSSDWSPAVTLRVT